jgi:hypothetical protein
MRRILGCSVLIASLFATRASAQQRPLVTEDPETIGSGLVLVEGGIDYDRDIFYPVSGLTGNRLRLPTLGVSFGVSSIAEIQIDGGIYQRLTVTDREDAPRSSTLDFSGDQTSSIDDLVIGTKVRLAPETAGRPAMGIRFATRLPTASTDSGLGLGTTDFFTSFLIGKTVQSIRVVGNVGIASLANPVEGDPHTEALTYGLSLARAVRQGVEVVGEVNGRADLRDGTPPPGTESRGAFRFGARITHGTVRIDGGVIIGMTARDPSVGFTGGFTWVFRGFTVP